MADHVRVVDGGPERAAERVEREAHEERVQHREAGVPKEAVHLCV